MLERLVMLLERAMLDMDCVVAWSLDRLLLEVVV